MDRNTFTYLRQGYLHDQQEHAAYDEWLREHARPAPRAPSVTADTLAQRRANDRKAAELGIEI